MDATLITAGALALALVVVVLLLIHLNRRAVEYRDTETFPAFASGVDRENFFSRATALDTPRETTSLDTTDSQRRDAAGTGVIPGAGVPAEGSAEGSTTASPEPALTDPAQAERPSTSEEDAVEAAFSTPQQVPQTAGSAWGHPVRRSADPAASLVRNLVEGQGSLAGDELHRLQLYRADKLLAAIQSLEEELGGKKHEGQRKRLQRVRQHVEALQQGPEEWEEAETTEMPAAEEKPRPEETPLGAEPEAEDETAHETGSETETNAETEAQAQAQEKAYTETQPGAELEVRAEPEAETEAGLHTPGEALPQSEAPARVESSAEEALPQADAPAEFSETEAQPAEQDRSAADEASPQPSWESWEDVSEPAVMDEWAEASSARESVVEEAPAEDEEMVEVAELAAEVAEAPVYLEETDEEVVYPPPVVEEEEAVKLEAELQIEKPTAEEQETAPEPPEPAAPTLEGPADALGGLSTEQLAGLLSAVEDKAIRVAVIDRLADQPSAESLQALYRCLDDEDPEIQLRALEAAETLLAQTSAE